jgi:hypothetical protein
MSSETILNNPNTNPNYDFDKENIHSIIQSNNSSKDNSSYGELLKEYVEINKLKIAYIKYRMNDHVNNNLSAGYYDDDNKIIPPYLNYLLSIYIKSFPQIKKHLDKFISIIQKIDNIDIHPMIFQIVFINLIHSTYIYELCSDPTNILTQSNIERISNIQSEVGLGMNAFSSIFENVDMIFKQIEDNFGFNNVLLLPYNEYNIKLSNFLNNYDKTSLENLSVKFNKLNYLLTHIDHLTEYDINDIFLNKYLYTDANTSFENGFLKLDSDKIINKFDNDMKMLETIMDHYLKSYISNYNYVKKFDAFSNIDIDPISFIRKNSIYYWTDYCSTLNGNIFDMIFKSFTDK